MHKFMIAAAAVSLAASTPALASDDRACTTAPKEQWLPIEQHATRLAEQGYTVREIEMEGSCVEAKVKDKAGASLELYLDPATGSVSKREED